MKGSTIAILALVAIILIAACAIAAVLILQPFGGAEPTATVAPTAAATSTQPAVEDGSWERIQAAGKIVVGTSADYPPFEFFRDDLQIDGFDVALMDQIGQRLGVQVEYQNFAFDGLGGALQLGQIDAAIAAISLTAERQAVVDFTNVYLVGLDAILTTEQMQVSIGRVEDLAGRPVGVQSGSVYEQWLREALVDTGLTQASNLYVYQKLDQALSDMQAGRIEFVAMDMSPADVAVEKGGFRIAGQGMNQQNYALALPKGAVSLKAQIDGVLTALHNDGVINELARTYLNIDQVPPTPTPAPTSTPGPPPSCIDGLAFMEHLSHDDKDLTAPPVLNPGEPFTKRWRVQNTGTCTWDSSYRLVYAQGNVPAAGMGGNPVAVVGQVAPGENYDVEVDLVAPLKAGTYVAHWQMENGQRQGFGEWVPVAIQVPAVATATPGPTQTPVPGISFTVDRTNIKAGECVTFQWKVENVKAVYFYAEGEHWPDHGVAGEGSQGECPPHSTTYYLRVVLQDESVEVREITIYVEPSPADAPYIKRFTVDPPSQISMGQCVEIRWNVEGEVDNVTVVANGVDLWDNAPVKGNLQDCPPGPGSVTYGVEAVGPGGTSRQQQTISVSDPSTATPIPTSAPDLPVIYSFSVSPSQVASGECVGISWSVGGGATFVTILRNGSPIIDDAGFSGQQMDCLDNAGDYLYRLEAYNIAGQSDAREVSVNVSGPEPPENPLAGTRWNATAVDGTPVLAGTTLTANFGADGSLNGSSGCNSYSGSYSTDGESLSVSPTIGTGILCAEPDGIMEQEGSFLTALSSAAAFSMEGGQLYLLNGAGQAVIEFVAPLH